MISENFQTAWTGGSRAWIDLHVNHLYDDEANNRSRVNMFFRLYKNGSQTAQSGNTSTWSITSNVGTWSGSFTYNLATMGEYQEFFNLEFWVDHLTDGSKTVTVTEAKITPDSPLTTAAVGLSVGLTDFVRLPSAPAAPTLSRSSDGSTVTVTSAVASSVMTVTDYHYQWSVDNTNWNGPNAMGTSRVASFTGTPTQPYYFRTRAFSSEGWGAYSASSVIAGVPSAPASISATRSGQSVTVTGSAGYDGGSAITAAYVQLSTDGVNWSNTQTLTSWSYTYTNLNLGTQYFFRVWAVNAIGSSSATSSAGLSIPNVPASPTSITATRTARNVTVTVGNADGQGATVTGYLVQYSTNGGTSWSTAQAMTSQAYTYTGLTAAQTYLFRAYATNEMGVGATVTSTALFVPAGGKRWDGSTWVSTTIAKRWDGTNWVDLTIAKRWDGTNWVDLS